MYGAIVTFKGVHRRSPLVQEGLEIPVQVEVRIQCNGKKNTESTKYIALVEELYEEPVDGNFKNVTASILREVDTSSADEDNEGITESQDCR